jgi:acyl carrier protein
MVVLISEIQEKFGVVIDGSDVIPENFISVNAIAQLIESSR